MQSDLRERLRVAAASPVLLVACDYDGTLAEIVPDPSRAAPSPAALVGLRALTRSPWTKTAVVSGRSLESLRRFMGDGPAWMVGSHGAEWPGNDLVLSEDKRLRLDELTGIIGEIVHGKQGLLREVKPAAVALHTRTADRAQAGEAVRKAIDACRELSGVHVRHGSEVVEFMVLEANKGEAIKRLRHTVGATAVVFVGDDQTDEDVFRTLSGDDVGIKVGPGETAARYRVSDVTEVARLLEELVLQRSRWAQERNLARLDQCAVLSDQRTMAVVTPGARISWLCLPRLDSAAMFADLIGGESAGLFQISPTSGGAPVRCAYDGDSFVLVTEWPGLRVTDYLDCSAGRAFQKAGRADLIRVIEGSVPARIVLAPRLDYGRVATRFRVREDGLEIEGSNDPIAVRCPGIEWTITDDGIHQTAEAVVQPSSGRVVLEMRYGSANLKAAPHQELDRRQQTVRFWSGWAQSLAVPNVQSDLVIRSALVLKALCYGPTGAIAAAATTSLPEHFGGSRNWDYRFCWPRDAALSACALMQLGNTGHTMKLLDWILEVVDRCETPDRLRPIYTVAGALLPPEAELGHLSGYAQSRPVRIGNAAANQVQLDVFGPIAHLVAMLAERGAPTSPDHWRLVRSMVRAVEARWMEPDHGIWEIRLDRRHHVHSKVMCWHTVDRALVVEEAVCGTRNSDWGRLRDAIRADVLERGWNSRIGAFTGAYGHEHADASVLAIGLTGLIEASDPRWHSTVEYIARELLEGSTVRRYRIDDGLPGDEGGMHICTGWLIESLLSIGKRAEAVGLFEKLVRLVRGPGIMSEQYDDRHGLAAGNIAQAYSHLALINAAVALDRAGVRLENRR